MLCVSHVTIRSLSPAHADLARYLHSESCFSTQLPRDDVARDVRSRTVIFRVTILGGGREYIIPKNDRAVTSAVLVSRIVSERSREKEREREMNAKTAMLHHGNANHGSLSGVAAAREGCVCDAARDLTCAFASPHERR